MTIEERTPKRSKGSRLILTIIRKMEERLNFTDWIKWAETTNSLGIANVEPAIILFLKDTSNNTNIFE